MERLSLAALLAWAAVATALALSPYTFESDCLICRNGAHLDAETGQLVFESAGMARTAVPETFNDALSRSGSLIVDMTVTPETVRQGGPARILSYSSGRYSRNFTLGQQDDRLIVRLRTRASDPNGRKAELVLPDVFAAGTETRIRVRHDARGTIVATSGAARARFPYARADFTTWDDGPDLLLGNETTGDRPWLGSVGDVTIRAGPQGPVLAEFDFADPDRSLPGALGVADLRLPARFAILVSLAGEGFQIEDFTLHLGMLLPVGLLATLAVARDRPDILAVSSAMLVAVAFALAIEIAQYFIASRTMSALDFLWGVLGGLLGAAGGLALRRRLRG